MTAVRPLWLCARRVDGTPAALFLGRAGIAPPYPPAFRFTDVDRQPTLLAAITGGAGQLIAVAVTHITRDGMLDCRGAARTVVGDLGDGAVSFGTPGADLALTATAEAAWRHTRDTGAPCWACIYLARARFVAIPPQVREVRLVYGDQVIDVLDARLFPRAEARLL